MLVWTTKQSFIMLTGYYRPCPYINSPNPPNHLWSATLSFFHGGNWGTASGRPGTQTQDTSLYRDHALSISVLQFVKIAIHQDKGECAPWKPCWPYTKKSGHTPRSQVHQPPISVSNTISNRRNQGTSEKWLILGLEWGIHRMSLEHLVVAESKAVLKRQNDAGKKGMSEGHRSQMKESQWPKLGWFGQQNK